MAYDACITTKSFDFFFRRRRRRGRGREPRIDTIFDLISHSLHTSFCVISLVWFEASNCIVVEF